MQQARRIIVEGAFSEISEFRAELSDEFDGLQVDLTPPAEVHPDITDSGSFGDSAIFQFAVQFSSELSVVAVVALTKIVFNKLRNRRNLRGEEEMGGDEGV